MLPPGGAELLYAREGVLRVRLQTIASLNLWPHRSTPGSNGKLAAGDDVARRHHQERSDGYPVREDVQVVDIPGNDVVDGVRPLHGAAEYGRRVLTSSGSGPLPLVR
jgi:hypothetical protein